MLQKRECIGFLCCVTSYRKLHRLAAGQIYDHRSVDRAPVMVWVCSLLGVSEGWNQGVHWEEPRLKHGVHSRAHIALGRI